MPDDRLARTRATLPEGYQFGDAAECGVQLRTFLARRKAKGIVGDTIRVRLPAQWTPQGIADWVDARAAEDAYGHQHDFVRWDISTDLFVCRCGATSPARGWNVIEGDPHA